MDLLVREHGIWAHPQQPVWLRFHLTAMGFGMAKYDDEDEYDGEAERSSVGTPKAPPQHKGDDEEPDSVTGRPALQHVEAAEAAQRSQISAAAAEDALAVRFWMLRREAEAAEGVTRAACAAAQGAGWLAILQAATEYWQEVPCPGGPAPLPLPLVSPETPRPAPHSQVERCFSNTLLLLSQCTAPEVRCTAVRPNQM